MLQIVVTGDESRCFQFDSEMKRQNTEWRGTNYLQQKEVNVDLFSFMLPELSITSLFLKASECTVTII